MYGASEPCHLRWSSCPASASVAPNTLGPLARAQVSFRRPTRARFTGTVQGPHRPMSVFALAVLPGCPRCEAPQDPPASVLPQFQPPLQSNLCAESKNTLVHSRFCFHHLAKGPSMCRAPGSPQPAPILVSAVPPATPPRHPLHRAPWNTLACTHFSFNYPARAPSVTRSLGRCSAHPCQF